MLILLTFLAAFLIESIGTYVSVVGLSALFGSNPIIIALVVALDIGKLVVVSLLYKHWRDLGKIMRSYALVAATVTMVITSSGAAGYLSAEFQKAIAGTQESSQKIEILKAQQAKYEERKKQIDQQIASLPEKTTVTQRLRLMNGFKAEQQDLQTKISELDKQLPALQLSQIGAEAHAGPILVIAKAFNIPVEEAVKWVILIIIPVFDPLAVFLLIAGNLLLELREKKREAAVRDFEEESLQNRIKVAQEVFSEPEPEPETGGPNRPMELPPALRGIEPDVPWPRQPEPEVAPEVVPTVTTNAPDTTLTKTYSRQDLIDLGVTDETLIAAGYSPRSWAELPDHGRTPKTFDETHVEVLPKGAGMGGWTPKTFDETHVEPLPKGAEEPAQDSTPVEIVVAEPPPVSPIDALPQVPSLPPVREVITREQLIPQTGYAPTSSLNAVKADESVTFVENPAAETAQFYTNLR